MYKFYFDEIQHNLTQRKQTLHLAMTYFTQTIMRCPWLQKSEIGIIASSALLLASKFDEIDYSLPSIKKIKKEMDKSKYFWDYDTDFAQWNFISWEKEIWKRLDWNFNQSTSFHFIENLILQGILKPNDKIGLIPINDQMQNILMPSPSASNIKTFSSNQINDKRINSAYKQEASRKATLCKRYLKNLRLLNQSQSFVNFKSFISESISHIDKILDIKRSQSNK